MAFFSLRRFDEVLRDVQAARAWYASLRIPTVGTRLEEIERVAQGLVDDLATREPERVVAQWGTVDTYYALSDGMAFGKIAREISKVGPNLLPQHNLRTILGGPLSPLAENPGDASVNARNFFTELELAAEFSEKGLTPAGFDDLEFGFEGVDCFVQCKRLHSVHRVVENIQHAYRQLQGKLPNDRSRGFIALAVERVLGLDGQILRLEPGEDLSAKVSEKVDEFRRVHQHTWLNFVDPRVVAIIVIIRFLCLTVSRNVIGPGYYVAFANLASPEALQAADLERLRRLVQFLQTAQEAQRNPDATGPEA